MVWLDERIGVLFVTAEKGRRFEKFSSQRLQRIADIATLAIQRCRLLNRIENLSNANVDFTKRLGTESLTSRLTTIARHASEILGAEMCGVFRVRGDEIMTLEASFGHREKGYPIGQPFPIVDEKRSGLTGAIAHRLRAKYSEFIQQSRTGAFKEVINKAGSDLTADIAVKQEPDNSPSGQCHSLLAIPLLSIPPAPPRMTGLLRISNKRGVGGSSKAGIKFTSEDEWILRIFSEAAAVAIETAELFSNREAQLSLYRTLSEVLTGKSDLYAELDLIARQLAVVLKKSYCRILFCDDSSRSLWRVRAAGLHPRTSGHVAWTPGKGETVEAMIEYPEVFGTQIFSSSISEGAAAVKTVSDAVELPSLKSMIRMPLQIDSRVVGALEFGELRDPRNGRGTLTADEIDLASNPASLIAELLRRDALRKLQAELLAAFDSSLASIRRAQGLNTLLPLIIKEACSLLKHDFGGIIIQRFRDGPIELVVEGTSPVCLDKEDKEALRLFEESFALTTTVNLKALRELCRHLGVKYASTSFLATRLDNGTQARCALFLTRKDSPIFQSIAELETLGKFGRQCSTSLTHSVVRDRLGRTHEAMNLLGQTMAQGQPEDALKNALAGIRHATQCDSVVLYKIDSRSSAFLGVYDDGDVNPENIWPPDESVMDTAVGKILKGGVVHFAQDASADEIMNDTFQEREKVKSAVGMPIPIKKPMTIEVDGRAAAQEDFEEKVNVGVLFLNFKQVQLFTEDEKRIIQLFTPFVAVAVRNQELHEQEQKKAKIQRALLKSANLLAKSLDLDETILEITKQAYEIAKAAGRDVNFVGFGLKSGDKAMIRSAYPPEELIRIAKVDLTWENGEPKGIVGKVIAERKTLRVNNVLADKQYYEVHAGTKSELCVPILSADAAIGFVNIESPILNTFYEEDEDSFELFAALAADAIRNAQQYADLSGTRLVAIADIWAGILAHDYSDEAEGIIRAATFLQSDMRANASNSELNTSTDLLVERARKLRDLIPSKKIDYESFPLINLNDHLTGWSNERKATLKQSRINLSYRFNIGTDVRVRVHPKLLDRVLDLFLKNATAAMESRSKKSIALTVTKRDSGVEIALSDTGPAVPDSIWQQLGVMKVESFTGGKGLGILIAGEILKFCKGDFLKLRNTEGEVTVGIFLPEIEGTTIS